MKYTHFDEKGNAVMVDVSEKEATQREATATGRIHMSQKCYDAVRSGTAGKGDVLGVAQVAGIMACKRCSELIPLCHTLNLNNCKVKLALHDEDCAISATCTVRCAGKTGVEMEALTGTSVALLTVYDMCKAIDKRMEIGGIHLVEKTGGRSGHFRFEDVGKEGEDPGGEDSTHRPPEGGKPEGVGCNGSRSEGVDRDGNMPEGEGSQT